MPRRDHVSRKAAEQRGRRGETIAVWWLRLHGWRILARRVRVGAGEVDIVARRGRTVAFIEVKWRARAEALDHAIDAWRMRRVAAASAALVARFAGPHDSVQVDVVLVAPRTWPRRIANVWQPGAGGW